MFSIFWKQLSAILWKNWMLKRAHPFSSLAELFLPAIFMALLILIKSVTDVYHSPNVAYYCGNTFPWFYSSSLIDSASSFIPFLCTQKPDTCQLANYYQYEEVIYSYEQIDLSGYGQYGYIPSAATEGITQSENPIYSSTIADPSTIYSELGITNPSLPFANMVERLVVFGSKMGIAPKNTKDEEAIEQAQNLITFLAAKSGYSSSQFIYYFDSQKDLSNYITNDKYNDPGYGKGKIAYAVVFNSVDTASGYWDYSIRVNYTSPRDQDVDTIACLSGGNNVSATNPCGSCKFTYSIPSTKYYTQDLYKPGSIDFINGYTYSGFSTLQQTVDEFIFAQYGEEVSVMASVSPMPTSTYITDTFQYVISSTLGIFYMLSFLYPVSRIVRALVLEKETRVKEGMKMMGLTDTVYNLSWLITLVLQMTIVSVLITIISARSVFEYSNKVLVFFYFEMFSLAVISLCFLLATLFSRSKVASLIAPMIFFASFFPYYAVSDAEFDVNTKTSTCLLAPACFALGANVFADYEGGLVGVQRSNTSMLTSNFSYSICVGMLFVDAVIYGILAWYLDKVIASEFGTALPFYFFLMPSYWLGKSISLHESGSSKGYAQLATSDGGYSLVVDNSDIPVVHSSVPVTPSNSKLFEPVPNELLQQQSENRCVSIQGLRKVYSTANGEDRVAVHGLNADFYEGQITVLLGHNGAGKSTAINMLVGMTSPTSGDAFIRGKRITRRLSEIRRFLGVCPQHDILFPELTVTQHLQIFAAFKGFGGNVNEAVKKMIGEVGLMEKAHMKAKSLSGGQKRKLSLGIALIGDSSVVILDEPTSGMDPYSRRSTWEIIQRNKKGRIILLTTHFMDEADILGDRIFIMAEGKLQTAGSPMFLKGVFGVGYTLHIVKASPSHQESNSISSLVLKEIPEAEAISNVGAEQSFRLPFTASSNLTKLFVELDQLRPRLIKEYGISVTTLEEVFIRVGKGLEISSSETIVEHSELHHNDKEQTKTGQRTVVISEAVIEPKRLLSFDKISKNDQAIELQPKEFNPNESTFFYHFMAMFQKRLIYGRRDKRMFVCQLLLPVALVIVGLGLLLILADITQPDLVLSPNHYNPSYSTTNRNFVPFSISSDEVYGIPSSVSYEVFDRFNGDPSDGVYAIAVNTSTADYSVDMFETCSQGALPLWNTSNYLLYDQPTEERGSTRYGAVTMSSITNLTSLVYNILVNESAIHGVGVYVNLVHSAFLQVKSGLTTATIVAHNYPLPVTYEQQIEAASANSFVAALFLSIAFCFIPSSYASFIVKEREVKATFQQIISGANPQAYWVSAFVWDILSYIPTALCIFATLYAFGIENFTLGQGPVASILLLLLFGPAVAAFTYMTSFQFKSHSTAQIVQMFGNFLTGLCLMVVHFVLTVIPSTTKNSDQLRNFFRLFPSFCLGDGLLMLALCSKGRHCPGVDEEGYHFDADKMPLEWDVVGGNVVFLAIEGVVYFLITLLIEYLLSFPKLLAWLHEVDDPGLPPQFYTEEDNDVRMERHRVRNGLADNDVVRLHDLRKVYPLNGMGLTNILFKYWNQLTKSSSSSTSSSSSSSYNHCKVAVQSLSFGIPKGECFGLLGINGGGKTTTLSILCGEFPPTEGTGYIDGCDVRSDQTKIRRKIGFCPQFDALLELLTVREHLELYARIKGVSAYVIPPGVSRSKIIQRIVESKLDQLDLRDFEHKSAGSLSGGNKRKLSVAIALIGDPSIVYLDEPSTGMDPVARRFMWDVISRVSTHDGRCSVILTTHSMEEAEALCTRIGVMVNGRLRCLGSSQHLKERFGNGYEVNIKTKHIDESIISKFMTEFFIKTAVVSEETVRRSSERLSAIQDFRISRSDLKRVCATLGRPDRYQLISANAEGRILFDILHIEGSIPLQNFASWWLTEDQADGVRQFFVEFDSMGSETQMLERSTAHSFRYRILKPTSADIMIQQQFSLAKIFDTFEKNKDRLQIQEYSVGQTTLEQIFNQFAASQDNPEVQARTLSVAGERETEIQSRIPSFLNQNALDEGGSSHVPLLVSGSPNHEVKPTSSIN